MKCPSCNTSNVFEARFCVECGSPLYKICPECNSETFVASKFCPACGSKFDARNDALQRYRQKLEFHQNISICDGLSGSFAVVKKNDLYGVVNLNTFDFVVPCEFESYRVSSPCNYVLLKLEDKWFAFNPFTGSRLSDTGFEDVETEETNRHLQVKLNGYWGVIETMESSINILIPCEYIELHTHCGEDKPQPSQHKSGKWGVVLRSGEKLIEFEYDEIVYHEPFGHSLYYLRKGQKWGLFYSGGNFRKNKFYPCEYTKEQLSNLKYYE